MFTGIVEETGVVLAVKASANAIHLAVGMQRCGRGLKPGDSVAVNGCCLTAASVASRASSKRVEFDLLRETWQRTNLQFVRAGSLVNLERPLRANGRFDGHFVTGHIDGPGRITRWERAGADHILDIAAPPELLRYIVSKGSVAVDGISLTVARVSTKSFRVWIIPHTYEVTVLREREVGDVVNLEADILGKYVERFAGSGRRRK